MKRRRNKQQEPIQTLRLWTHAEAARAVPYLRSVMGSLREHWLEAQSNRRGAELLSGRSGRPDRARLLSGQVLHASQEGAETRFDEALDELMRIDVYLVDPVRGVALIPFRKEDDLAWFVFNRFDRRGLAGWRYQNDPLDTCRPFEPDAPPGRRELPTESAN